MSSPASLSLANINELVGKEIGVSDWVTVDQARINTFSDCTGDSQWIHTNPERAQRESPYRTTIAHGYLLLSLLGQMTQDVVIEPFGTKAALNYGIDRVRFIAPVKAGSRVRARIKLIAAEDKGSGRVLITTENTLEIEGEDKPALVGQLLSMALS